MARPKKDDALGATAYVGVRLHPDLRAAMDRVAASKGVALADEIRTAMQEHVERFDRKERRK